jgi:hypothetical protein
MRRTLGLAADASGPIDTKSKGLVNEENETDA